MCAHGDYPPDNKDKNLRAFARESPRAKHNPPATRGPDNNDKNLRALGTKEEQAHILRATPAQTRC